MNVKILEELYLNYIREHHRKALTSEEYVKYMEASREFCRKLSEEQLIEYEKLTELKLDVEDEECLGTFKNGFMWGMLFAKAYENSENE